MKTKFKVRGLEWSIHARIIVALLRKLGKQEIVLTEDELEPRGGLLMNNAKPSGVKIVVFQKSGD